jgi:hypothetical protein
MFENAVFIVSGPRSADRIACADHEAAHYALGCHYGAVVAAWIWPDRPGSWVGLTRRRYRATEPQRLQIVVAGALGEGLGQGVHDPREALRRYLSPGDRAAAFLAQDADPADSPAVMAAAERAIVLLRGRLAAKWRAAAEELAEHGVIGDVSAFGAPPLGWHV